MRWMLASTFAVLLSGCASNCMAIDRPHAPAPADLGRDLNGTWSPGGASTGIVTEGGHLWLPLPVGIQAPLNLTLHRLEVKLAWTNGPTAFGDLAIGVGSGTFLRVFRNAGRNADLGPQSESLVLTRGELEEHHLQARGLAVGPASDVGYLAPSGVPYSIQVRATFVYEPQVVCDGGAGGAGGGGNGGARGGDGVSVPGLPLAVAAGGLLGAAGMRRKAIRR